MQYHDNCQPLYALINTALKSQNLSWNALYDKIGYANKSKAARRVQQILMGDLSSSLSLDIQNKIRLALNLNEPHYQAAINECNKLRAAKVAQVTAVQRAEFVPYGRLICVNSIPNNITACALVNGGKFRLVKLEINQPIDTHVSQMQRYILKNPSVLFFGKVIGFWVCYTYDFSIRYDLKGNVLEQAGHLPSSGSSITIGKRTLSAQQASAIFNQPKAT